MIEIFLLISYFSSLLLNNLRTNKREGEIKKIMTFVIRIWITPKSIR